MIAQFLDLTSSVFVINMYQTITKGVNDEHREYHSFCLSYHLIHLKERLEKQ
jgi:hypothetical protein